MLLSVCECGGLPESDIFTHAQVTTVHIMHVLEDSKLHSQLMHTRKLCNHRPMDRGKLTCLYVVLQ